MEPGWRSSRLCKVVDMRAPINTGPTTETDPLVIAGKEFTSRLIMGTGGAPSLEVMEAALQLLGSPRTPSTHD